MDPQQQLHKYLVEHWQTFCLYAGLFAILLTALVWRLGSLTTGYSTSEVQAYQASQSIRHLLSNPINAPYYIDVRLLSFFYPHNYVVTRVVSVFIGLFVLVLFALVVHMWQGRRTALAGTLLFGLSAWFLHTARLGTPDVAEFGVFALVAAGYWLKASKSRVALVACFVSAAVLLYVPAMAWFILVGLVWQWRPLVTVLRRHLWTLVAACIIGAGMVAPIGFALYKNHSLIRPYLALPPDLPAPSVIFHTALRIPFNFFIHAAPNPVTWLGSAPILDAFSLAMFVLGSYLYLRQIQLASMRLYGSILLLTLALMSVGSPITFSILMPSVYLAVAAGIHHLFNTWFTVFPKNPIARGVAWTFMGAVIGLVCFYHVTHYFVGWPVAQQTQAVFTQTKP